MKWRVDRKSLEKEVKISFIRTGGPGGQHRNRAETGVRIYHLPTNITVEATERRSQLQNRELAFKRLQKKLRELNIVPKKRKLTKPTKTSVKKRLQDKKKRGQKKQQRHIQKDETD